MTQNRPPPAYQEYASNMMARAEYRVMSLLERGLMDTMRRECWVNHGVPADPAVLAKFLGYDLGEIRAALPAVMPIFALQNGKIVCPELDDYRAHLGGIRVKQAEGGKKGAAKTNGKHKPSEPNEEQGAQASSSNPRVTRDSTRESLVKSSSVKSSTTQSLKKDFPHADKGESPAYTEWMNEGSGKTTINDEYERASNGY